MTADQIEDEMATRKQNALNFLGSMESALKIANGAGDIEARGKARTDARAFAEGAMAEALYALAFGVTSTLK
ncbi:MAG: hypothetical protein HQ477_11950 [Chloroflexi bacterium]|nr:hypothetical protein [Chloroflexota bacterium]